MKNETKSIDFQLKASTSEKNVIEGYGAVFGNKDSHSDIIERGAFLKTIKERGDNIFLVLNHNWDQVIGRVIYLKEDSKGLYFKAKVSETALGRDVLVLMRDGVLKKCSIGYKTDSYRIDREREARILEHLTLFEISVVFLPSNDRADITSVKSVGSNSFDELRHLLRARSAAKAQSKELNAIKNLQQLLHKKYRK